MNKIFKNSILFLSCFSIFLSACSRDKNIEGLLTETESTSINPEELINEEEYENYPSEGDYIYSILENGTAEIVKYTGNDEDLIIPKTLGEYQVTTIGYIAFYQCESLINITIPDGVLSIGIASFAECTNLKTVVLPDSIISFDRAIFAHCKKLSNINIPKNLTVISKSAFFACESLTSIEIPEGVISIEDNAFDSCIKLYNLNIPNSIQEISIYAFFNCSFLNNEEYLVYDELEINEEEGSAKYVIINNFLLDLFVWKKPEIKIPDGVKNIIAVRVGDETIKSVIIPDSVTQITGGFRRCLKLEKVIIPNSVIKISDDSFSNCPLLTIYCEEGSYAEQYCIKKDIKFEII